MPLRGDLASFSLAEIFQSLSMNQSSGTLMVSDGENRRLLVFRNGILSLVGHGRAYVPKLGEFLLRKNVIGEEALAKALALQKEGGGLLGEVLVREGIVTEKQIREAVREKLEEEIYDLFLWKNAFFEFKKDQFPEGSDAAGPAPAAGAAAPERTETGTALTFNTSTILMEAVRRVDEWGRITESVPTLRMIFLPRAEVPPERGVGECPIPPGRLWPLLKREHAVRDLIEACAVSKFDVCKSLDALIRAQEVSPLPVEDLDLAFQDALRGGRYDLAARDIEYAMDLGAAAKGVRERMVKAFLGERGVAACPEPCRLTGTVERFDLPSFLHAVLLRRLTGTLRVRDIESERILYVSPEEVMLLSRGPRETPKFGQVLLRGGKLSPTDLDRALTVQRDDPRRLGEILVERGVLATEEVEEAVLTKAVQELFDLFLWRNAYFEFTTRTRADELTAPGSRPVRLALSGGTLKELVARIVRAGDILAKVSSSRAILTVVRKEGRHSRGRTTEEDVLALVNGVRTVGDIFRLTPRSSAEVCEVLYALMNQGAVRPLTLAETREAAEAALAEGQVETCLKMCAHGQELAPDDPGLKTVFEEAQARRPDAGEATREYRLEGDLESFSLAELVQSLYLNKHSGTLRVKDGRREKIVYFAQGTISLLTRGHQEVSRLGEILVDAGKVSEYDVERALEEQQGTGKRLGELLIERGLATEEDIQEAVEEKVRDELFDVFLWRNATFEFQKNYFPDEFTNPDAPVTRLALDTTRTLMAAISRIEKWEELTRELSTVKAVYRRTGAAPGPELSRRARVLLEPVDGRRTVEELLEESASGRFAAAQALAELKRANLIRPLVLDEVNAEAERAFEVRDFERCVKYYEYALQLDEGNEFLKRYIAEAKGNLSQFDAMRVRMKPFDLVNLFRTIVRGNATGTLSAKDGASARLVYLGRDEVAWLDEGPRGGPTLADVLRQGGRLPEKALSRAVEFQKRTGRDLLEVLEKQGALTPEARDEARREAARAMLWDLFSWREASIEFERSSYPLRLDDAALPVSRAAVAVAELLAGIAERREEWDRFRNALPSEKLILVAAERERGAPLLRRHKENPTLPLVDGRRTVAQVVRESGLSEFDAYRSLHDLVTGRVVRTLSAEEAVKAAENAWVFKDLPACQGFYEHALEVDRGNAEVLRRLELLRRGQETQVRRRLTEEFGRNKDLSAILEAVMRDARWGTLEATVQDSVRWAHFAEDRVTLLSRGSRPGRRLGEILVEALRATPAQIEKALAAQPRLKKRLGEILVLQGVLGERDLAAMVREKILEDLHELYSWEDAVVRFAAGDPPAEMTAAGAPVAAWEGDAAGLLSEALEREKTWADIATTIPSANAIFGRKDRPAGGGESRRGEAGGTGGAKNPVLAHITGRRSVAEVCARAGVPRYEALAAFLRLIRNDVIRPLEPEECRRRGEEAYLANDLPAAATFLRFAVELDGADERTRKRLERIEASLGRAGGRG